MTSSKETRPSPWFLYIIETSAGALYTGITTDIERRFAEHNDNGKKTARFLRGKGPLRLLFNTDVGDRSTALRMEAAVKKLSREKKRLLINTGKLPTLG